MTSSLLDRFDHVRGSGPWWSARCPAHHDRHASLGVGVDRGGIWRVFCHAGCSSEDVLRAAGLQPEDLREARVAASVVPARTVGSAEREQLRAYLAACRNRLADDPRAGHALGYAGARFGLDREQALDLHLGYDPGSVDVERPAFVRCHEPRLTVPFVVAGRLVGMQARALGSREPKWATPAGSGWGKIGGFALDRPGVVLVTEGPSDALSAVGLGYPAVAIRGAGLACTPARARRALAPVLDELRGRPVVVAGDGDDAGRRFNVGVAQALHGAARSVRVLDLPDGLDLCSLAQRHGREHALHALAEAAA